MIKEYVGTPFYNRIALYAFIAIMAACSVSFTGVVWAVPPQMAGIDEATRQTDLSARQDAEKYFQKTTPRKAPKVEEPIPLEKPEGPSFEVKRITLEGVKTFSVEDFKATIDKYENKVVTNSELKALAKEIEREYFKKGVIVACFLPPQDIKDGAITLRVIESKMGELEVKKMRYFNKDRIQYYWAIEPGEVLRYDKISRSLQFINKNPDRLAKAALHAGDRPETTDVVIDVATNFPLHITATLDHEGVPSTGKLRSGIGLVENNLIGLDDTLILGYTGGKDFNGIYGYHRVPITSFGTTLMYGYSQSNSFPQKDFAIFDISSKLESYSAFVYQDLFQKDEYKGEISFGLEKSDKRVFQAASGTNAPAPGVLNVDRLTIATVAATLTGKGEGNFTTIKPAFSQGIMMLGARPKNPLSSRGAGSTFSKFVYTASFKQALVKNYQASLKFTGQAASEKLTPQQELYMGGIDSVRGYPAGDYLADTGFFTNIELLIPASFLPDWIKFPYSERPIKDDITGVLFFDYGYGSKRGMIQGEQSFDRMASIGAGVRVRLLNQALLRLEWGIPLDPLVNRPITEGGGNRPRLHFSIDFQDNMPEEIDGFRKTYREEYIKEAAWRILKVEMQDPKSPLAKVIYSNLYEAHKARKAGKIEDAIKYYTVISNVGNNVYRQTAAYLKDSYNTADQLRKKNEAGAEFYKNCEFDKAEEIWQKIVAEAKTKPLVLDFVAA